MKKKFAFILLFYCLWGLFSMTLEFITKEAEEVASWIEKYYLVENKYPEKIEDVLEKDFDCFGYKLSYYYSGLLRKGYDISIDNNNLIIFDKKTQKKCIYDFETKFFIYFEDEKFIRKYTTSYFQKFH